MKFDAYPFQDYGIIEGELIEVSPTTSEIETPDGKTLAYDLLDPFKKLQQGGFKL